MKLLPLTFYQQDTVTVARELLGKIFITYINGERIVGMFSETEAYRSDDPACHAYKGQTNRNAALFGPVGSLYVYISYGIHFCFNVVSREQHIPAGGVLIRAFIPLEGHAFLKHHMAKKVIAGPGNATKALAITLEHNHVTVLQEESIFKIHEGLMLSEEDIIVTPRIGITQAADKPWRFYINPGSIDKIISKYS